MRRSPARRFRAPLTSDNLHAWGPAVVVCGGLLGVPLWSWFVLHERTVPWVGVLMVAVGVVGCASLARYVTRPVHPEDEAKDLLTWAPKLSDDWEQRRPEALSDGPSEVSTGWADVGRVAMAAVLLATGLLLKGGVRDGGLVFLALVAIMALVAGITELVQYLRRRRW